VIASEQIQWRKFHAHMGVVRSPEGNSDSNWAPSLTGLGGNGAQIGDWREWRPDSRPVGWPAVSDRTLVLLKPDAVERGLVGAIVSRFEAKGLTIVAMERRTLDKELLGNHYAEHIDQPFYDDLVTFMSRGPIVAMVVEGPEDTWQVVRDLVGATNPRKAAPGTIRGDLGIEVTENLVHGSDSADSAAREISIFFPDR
jgi:nucleoside-diphosphate kinase